MLAFWGWKLAWHILNYIGILPLLCWKLDMIFFFLTSILMILNSLRNWEMRAVFGSMWLVTNESALLTESVGWLWIARALQLPVLVVCTVSTRNHFKNFCIQAKQREKVWREGNTYHRVFSKLDRAGCPCPSSEAALLGAWSWTRDSCVTQWFCKFSRISSQARIFFFFLIVMALEVAEMKKVRIYLSQAHLSSRLRKS